MKLQSFHLLYLNLGNWYGKTSEMIECLEQYGCCQYEVFKIEAIMIDRTATKKRLNQITQMHSVSILLKCLSKLWTPWKGRRMTSATCWTATSHSFHEIIRYAVYTDVMMPSFISWRLLNLGLFWRLKNTCGTCNCIWLLVTLNNLLPIVYLEFTHHYFDQTSSNGR